MPRKPSKEHPELPFDAAVLQAEEANVDAPGESKPTAKKVGRPRKWESEADRKRAYRERLAADLAEPERLRRELRNAKRQAAETAGRLSEKERYLARAEAEIDRRQTRQSELESTVERLEARVADWRSRADALARNLTEERADRAASDRQREVRAKPSTLLELPNLKTGGVPLSSEAPRGEADAATRSRERTPRC